MYVEDCKYKKSLNALRWFQYYFCGDCQINLATVIILFITLLKVNLEGR